MYEPKSKASYSDWQVFLRVDRDVAREQHWSKWEISDAAQVLPLLDMVEAKGTCSGLQHLDTTATIECAGNRRDELSEGDKAEGIQWGPGVIANIFWSGEWH